MRTLAGLRIVVTRATHQAEELARPLRERGAEVVLVPVIEIAPPMDPGPLAQAAVEADRYDWIVFTSANAVTAFAAARKSSGMLLHVRVAVIGAATRAAAEAAGLSVRLMPEEAVAEALVESFRNEDLTGRRVLLPSAAVTRDVVAGALRAQGARVDIVEAYRNVIPARAAQDVAQVFGADRPPHWVTFGSSSAVKNLLSLAGIESLRAVQIAVIGPVTADTVRGYGLPVAAEAQPSTVAGLVASIELVAAIEHSL